MQCFAISSRFSSTFFNILKTTKPVLRCTSCSSSVQHCRLYNLWTLHTTTTTATFTGTQCTSQHNFYSTSSDLSELDLTQDITQDVLLYNSQHIARNESNKKILVVMPRQKAGPEKKTKIQGQHLLDETVTLVKSLSGWQVVGAEMISTANIHSVGIFGSTNLQSLREYVHSLQANAVVMATDMLRPVQQHHLATFFNVDVYDRFSLVLKIFKERATTKEAKLQLALAELNYVKHNLRHMKESEFSQISFSKSFGGGFDTFYQKKKRMLQEREAIIKKSLEKIEVENMVKKQHRIKQQIPTVAVIGYTNSGKTSLIKSLTHDAKLIPEDRLFATLDVSVHMAKFPSNLNALLVDTIGFITDIPTTLVHSFRSTLSEIRDADLLVHITDVSHPDRQQQGETVYRTLHEIEVPDKLIDTMIEVYNKVDKLSSSNEMSRLAKQGNLLVSTTERIGLDQLQRAIENAIIKNTQRLMFEIRVPNGGLQYQWLYREGSVVDCKPDDNDGNFMIMKVIITNAQWGKFKKQFRALENQ